MFCGAFAIMTTKSKGHRGFHIEDVLSTGFSLSKDANDSVISCTIIWKCKLSLRTVHLVQLEHYHAPVKHRQRSYVWCKIRLSCKLYMHLHRHQHLHCTARPCRPLPENDIVNRNDQWNVVHFNNKLLLKCCTRATKVDRSSLSFKTYIL